MTHPDPLRGVMYDFRHLPLVRHALGVKLAIDLDDHHRGRAELADLLHAAHLAAGVLSTTTQPDPADPSSTDLPTYAPTDVMRAGREDRSRVQHLTTDRLRSISKAERARGYRRGQVDLAHALGYDSPEALSLAVRSHRARARTEPA